VRGLRASTEAGVGPIINYIMLSERVRKVLAIADKLELAPTERVELADELLRSVPEPEQEAAEFTPEWTAELRHRLVDMKAAEARGEPAGVVMSLDELIEHVRATADTDE
jgi:hypothetical protein